MLLEALAWATLPASWPIRRMGYVSEMVGIGARALRCRESWRPHLKKSRGFLAEAMARPARKRRALIFGSGLLLDVPVADLAVAYDEVWLVDILQPLSARLRALFSPKLSLFAHDATEAIAPLHHAVRAWRLAGRDKDRPPPLPDIAPARFLDQEFDLVASVNLASQLPIVPRAWLTRGCAAITEAAREAWARRLIERHFAYLGAFSARGAVVALLADVERRILGADGTQIGTVDPLLGAAWPATMEAEWDWSIAPIPEFARDRAIINRVRAGMMGGAGDTVSP